jgi:hypothetical protein
MRGWRAAAVCCCVLAALTSAAEDEEVSATPWLEAPPASDISHRVPVYWGAVAAHAAGLVFVAVSLCTWAHGKASTLPLVLLGALWFTALDWAVPIAELELVGASWLFRVVPPTEGLSECGEISQCTSLDAARVAGPGVLVCAVSLCAPPSEFLTAIGDCRLPYGIIPNELEQAREMYVRVQGGDGPGGARSVIKTGLATSANANYDWDWRRSSLLPLLETKQALVRALRYAAACLHDAAHTLALIDPVPRQKLTCGLERQTC